MLIKVGGIVKTRLYHLIFLLNMTSTQIVEDIYSVFKDYYGEDRVDLQPFVGNADNYKFNATPTRSIIIYWPEVTVTNEYDESVVIWELWAKVNINNEGRLCSNPFFNRTEYNKAQWNSDYAHSHLSGINKADITEWRTSCLGSGPLILTDAKLKGSTCDAFNPETQAMEYTDFGAMRCYEDLDLWQLFAWELDKYVHVESISGVPYRKMANIGLPARGNNIKYANPCTFITELQKLPYWSLVRNFLIYVIQSKFFKFNFKDSKFNIGMSETELILGLSNLFIEYYNSNYAVQCKYPKDNLYKEFLKKAYLNNNKIYILDTSTRFTNNDNMPIMAYNGDPVFKFKGKDVLFKVRDATSDDELQFLVVLDPKITGYITYKILRFINSKYGKSKYTISCKTRVL